MDQKDKIIAVVFEAIEKVIQQLPADERLELSLSEQLVGPASKLDSLGIIKFIVAVEEGLHENFTETLTLANENAFSPTYSPFKSVQTLIEYIDSQLQVGTHGK